MCIYLLKLIYNIKISEIIYIFKFMETIELIYDLNDDIQKLNLGADYRNSNYKSIKIIIDNSDKYKIKLY